jgi:RNA polymerase sigma-70 factor (ECF subfamily)
VVLSDLDRTLLARCLDGTDGAWEDFVDRYLALITHVVTSTAKVRVGEIPDSWRDDVVAEVLLGLVDQDFAVLRRFRGQSSLGTYLVVVSRRIAVRKLAKMRRSAAVAQPIMAELSEESNDALELENQEEVQSLLANMPEEEATAIRMFHLENRSYGDIGHHFGIPENSVGPLLSRARDRMRNLRQDHAT